MSHFHLFVYGTLKHGAEAHARLCDCERVTEGIVPGTLYDIDGQFPALILYGEGQVRGEVWRCPADRLLPLDGYEGTADGLFRRVAVEADTPHGSIPCWTYAAGPALSRKLLPDRRIPDGQWPSAAAGSR
jgi:gamma-glutamylcyclotransferase (GGCT)/AIG2-like uncharacterized protein YtfP